VPFLGNLVELGVHLAARTADHFAPLRARLGNAFPYPAQAGAELREVVGGASREVDAKLDKISQELHDQRRFTREDARVLVDYAAERLGDTLDERIRVMRAELTELVQQKVEYFKSEVDGFFVQRQQDLARERRRLIVNVLIAVLASVGVALFSIAYQRVVAGQLNLYGLFRVIFLSLAGGYGAWLLVNLARRYLRLSEHRKDAVFLAMRYWGVLRPQSLFGQALVLALLVAAFVLVLFPAPLARLTGSPWLAEWAARLR
jgi:cation transport ATPase